VNPKELPGPDHAEQEILALIAILHSTGQRLEDLTGGQVDTVADREGRAFLLRRSQEQWRHNEARKMAAIVDALPARIALIDAQGVIVSVNHLWRSFADDMGLKTPASAVGANYLEHSDLAPGDHSSGAPGAVEGIRGVLAGRTPSFSTEYASRSATGPRWFLMSATAVSGDFHGGAVVMHLDVTERKRSEQATDRALQRLSEAQRVGQIGDWEWDLATQAISWSPQVYELLGRDPELGPPNLLEHNAIYDADSQRRMTEKVALAIESGEPQDYELKGRRANGEPIEVQGRAAPRRNEAGRVVALYGTVQDITERKRSEAAVKESEQRYHSLFENMLEGYAYCATIFEQDVLTDFVYLEVNTAFGTLTGLKDVVGKKVSDVIPGFLETNREFLELYGRVALSGRPEKREAFAKGPDLWLSITAYSSTRDQFVAVFDNITTRKSAEEALRGSAELLRVERGRLVMAQQVAKVGSWETDLSTGNVVWSDETHRIHETDPAIFQPAHEAYLAFVHPDDRATLEAAFALSVDRRSPAVIEHGVLLPGGRIKSVEQRWQIVVDSSGTPVRAVGTCQDITERKTAEKKIVHLSRVHAMLSGISTLIVRVRDRQELFKEACRIAVDAGGFRMSLIAVADPETGAIIPLASAGKDLGLMAQVAEILASPESGPKTMVAQAMRDKAPVVSNDSVNDPRLLLATRYLESEVRAIAILPLVIADEAVGVLALYSSEAGFFQEEEMKLLGELANDIAFCKGAIRSRDHKKKADEALLASLKDKEALLKEVHHRVKNNMQVITSLLRLESNRIDHATTKSVLKDMQNRIQAMAALHEAVYRSDNFSQVDLGVYLRQLTGQLGRSLVAVPGQIVFRLDLFSIALDLDQAIPCGLIVNELVSNALKHAFPAGRPGEVRIELERAGEENLRLRITDNGIGLPPNFDLIRSKSLGLQLVADLARQLGGSLQVGAGPVAVFEVTFSPNRK